MDPVIPRETSSELCAQIRKDPRNPELHFRLGIRRVNDGDPSSALDAFRMASTFGCSLAPIFVGRTLVDLNRFDDAADELRKVRVDSPYYCDALVLLGQILEAGEAYREASICFTRAIHHNRSIVEAHAGLTRLMDRDAPMERPANYQRPSVNEVHVVVLDGSEDSVECRVRRFRDLTGAKREIIVLSPTRRFVEESGICPNIACVMSQVSLRQRIDPARFRWVVLLQRGRNGTPFELSELHAEISVTSEESSRMLYFLRHVRSRCPRQSNVVLANATFAPLPHEEFLRATGYRFLWS